MPKVYSVRFLQWSGPDNTLAYSVPHGMRAVIRGIACSNLQSPGAQVFVAVNGIYAFLATFPGATESQNIECRMVAYQGEVISLSTYGPIVRAHVAGFLFEDPEGPPAAAGQLPAIDVDEGRDPEAGTSSR